MVRSAKGRLGNLRHGENLPHIRRLHRELLLARFEDHPRICVRISCGHRASGYLIVRKSDPCLRKPASPWKRAGYRTVTGRSLEHRMESTVPAAARALS